MKLSAKSIGHSAGPGRLGDLQDQLRKLSAMARSCLTSSWPSCREGDNRSFAWACEWVVYSRWSPIQLLSHSYNLQVSYGSTIKTTSVNYLPVDGFKPAGYHMQTIKWFKNAEQDKPHVCNSEELNSLQPHAFEVLTHCQHAAGYIQDLQEQG